MFSAKTNKPKTTAGAQSYHVTKHARERLRQRGIKREDMNKALESPFVWRTYEDDCQLLHAPAIAGSRHAWLTVVIGVARGFPEVITAYFRGIGSDEAAPTPA